MVKYTNFLEQKNKEGAVKKLILVASIVLLMVSCDDKPMEETNPFVGTWENDLGRWVFTNTAITVYYSNGDIYWSGTYTYDDSNITFHYEYRVPGLENEPNPLVWSYSISNNEMTIGMRSDYRKISG